jgi:hypothetical protein
MFLGPDDVNMVLDEGIYEKIAALPAYEEADEVMIHYTVTQECPFNCRGCIMRSRRAKGIAAARTSSLTQARVRILKETS